MSRHAHSLAFVLLLAAPSLSQLSQGVVPASHRGQSGNTNNSIPLAWTPTRYQQVFLGSELPASRRVVGLGFRFDEAYPNLFLGEEIELEIRLGYTSKGPSNLGTVFAANFDVPNTSVIPVRPRSVFRLPDQPRPRTTSPGQFEVQIPFLIPFSWVRQANRNLLVEIVVHGNSKKNFSFTYPVDAVSGAGINTARLWSSVPSASTGLVVHNNGLVMALLDSIQHRASYHDFGSPCAGTGGNAGVIVPRLARATWGGSKRGIAGRDTYTQQVIDRAELGPRQLFTGMQYRTTISEFDIDPRPVVLEVQVGHTRVGSSNLNTAFASNITSPLTTVFPKKNFIYPAIKERNQDLNTFRIRIPWSRPFAWDDTRNENLLVQIRQTDTIALSYPADATVNMSGTAMLWSNQLSAQSGLVLRTGHVLRFTTAAPGTLSPRLTRTNRPLLGKSFDVELKDARPTNPAVLFLGFSKSNWGPLSLPLGLAPLGAPSCELLVSPDLSFPALTDGIGEAAIRFQIPALPPISGLQWHNQWAVLDPVNALGLSWSQGGTAALGVQ